MVPSTLTRADAAHLLRRAGYGGTDAELDAFTGKSLSAAVSNVLGHTAANNAPAGPDVGTPSFITGQSSWQAKRDATSWWLHRMATLPQPASTTSGALPIHEKLAFFWHDHFACGVDKVGSMVTMWDQIRVFRILAMGKFEDIVRAASLHPAMLIYLDNHTNHYFAEQENFARELMELYTCGVGNFTEEDVVAMARAWTGHSIVGWNGSSYDRTYEYRSVEHNHNDKKLFGITDNWNGVKVAGGERDTIKELVQGARKTETSKFMARKLFHYFANYWPSQGAVDELAGVMRSNSMRIGPVIRAIFHHPEFWADTTRHALIKSPLEFVATWLKRIEPASFDDVKSLSLPDRLRDMDQDIFEPPSVAGWGKGTKWLSSAGAWARGEFLQSMQNRDVVRDAWPDIDSDDDPNWVAGRLLGFLGIEDISNNSRVAIREWFQDASFTASWSIDRNRTVIAPMCPEFHVY